MTIRLLGAFGVEHDGAPLDLGGHRQRAVLLALALSPNRAVTVDRLVDDVWGETPPRSAVVTVQRYLSHLRRILDGTGLDIERVTPGYVLRAGEEQYDSIRFERLVADAFARRDGGEDAIDAFDEALACWQDDRALTDFRDDDFAKAEAVRLDELRLACIEARFDVALALGHAAESVPALESLVAEHPLREGLRALLMRALHATGRRAEALRVSSAGRRLLGEELGLDPSRALQELEQAILRQDPGLVTEPLRAAPRLPPDLDVFVGRAEESSTVGALLDASRLVSLTGPGGTGKTRLALHVARQRADDAPGGTWLVELASVRDPSLVESALAAVLGVRAEGDEPAVGAAVRFLRGRRSLVVLDNCEHVTDAVVTVVTVLLRECEHLRILVTSRSPLDITGEATWSVPPLAPDDAALLFADRARAVAPAFALRDDNRSEVVEVCERLDCMPLAIELAAARVRVLSLAEVAARLTDRFELLTTGRRDAEERHRTLRATVQWSYDLLSPDERQVFERVSVFVGAFDVAAAEQIVGSAQVVDLLHGLVSKSLVTRVDDGRGLAQLRLLETLRAFGVERLAAAGSLEETLDRHADLCIERATHASTRIQGPDAEGALGELEVMHDDCRAALGRLLDIGDVDRSLALAGSLWPFWDNRYHVREGRAALERTLSLPGGRDDARLLALTGLTQLAWLDDDLGAAMAAFDAARALARATGARREEGRVLALRCEIARGLENDGEGARRFGDAALACLAGSGDAFWEAQALRVLTLVAWDAGDLDRADRLADECLARWVACGDVEKIAGARSMHAGIALERGDLDRAEPLFEAGLGGFGRSGEPAGVSLCLNRLGVIALERGDLDRAENLGAESLRVAEAVGHRRGIADALHVLGQVALERGDVDRAARLAGQALDRYRARGFVGDLVFALRGMARVSVALGDVDRAIEQCEEAVASYRASGIRRHVTPALELLADLRLERGERARAVSLLREAVAIRASMGDEVGAAATRERLAGLDAADAFEAS